MNTTTTYDTVTSTAIDVNVLREGYADVGDVTLHYVEAGQGPLVVLLHGFPGFWYSWREQIAPLVNAGFRVVAPDLRGYNLSSKPGDFTDYTADKPAADIAGLIRELGSESATVVGHDWGGSIAWTLAMNNPEVVDRLVILNAAHPRKLNEGLRNPKQLRRSWYFFYFQFPGLPGASSGPRQLGVLQGLPQRRPRAVHAAGAGSLRGGVVPAGGSQSDDRLLPRGGPPGVQAEGPSDLGADPRDLGSGRPLPRRRSRRASRGRRAEPRPRRAPCRTRRTGCTTTPLNASTNCSSTSSPPPRAARTIDEPSARPGSTTRLSRHNGANTNRNIRSIPKENIMTTTQPQTEANEQEDTIRPFTVAVPAGRSR